MTATALSVATPAPGVLLLTLARPQRRNAIDTALLFDLARAVAGAAPNDEIKCVVVTGDERAFSAGADIHEMREGGLRVLKNPQRAKAWRTLEHFPKPLIAAVDGVALGSGIELALTCDIVIAGEAATFGQPEVQLGGMPGDGGTQRLVRAVGKSIAMQMILTGIPIDARAALNCGLVAEVAPLGHTVARAIEIAAQIAAAPTRAVQAAKRAILQAFELPLAKGLAFERRAMWALAATPERNEALAAFAERRRESTGRADRPGSPVRVPRRRR